MPQALFTRVKCSSVDKLILPEAGAWLTGSALAWQAQVPGFKFHYGGGGGSVYTHNTTPFLKGTKFRHSLQRG